MDFFSLFNNGELWFICIGIVVVFAWIMIEEDKDHNDHYKGGFKG